MVSKRNNSKYIALKKHWGYDNFRPQQEEIIDQQNRMDASPAAKRGRKKIEPGTPHPTDRRKIRGYDGRWVTRQYFNQQTAAKKGKSDMKFELPNKFDQWRENPPEKYKKIGKQTDALNSEIIKVYKGESDQDLNALLKKIDNHMNKLTKEIYDKNPAEADRKVKA